MARILVFERNPERQMAYFEMLPGHEVVGSADLGIALRKIRTDRPDLIIADWFGSDGVKLIEELERFHDYVAPPVWLIEDVPLTVSFRAMRSRALQHGARGLIPRNISPAMQRCYVNAALMLDRGGIVPTVFVRDVSPTERRELLGDEHIDDILAESPLVRLAEYCGGMGVLDRCVEASGVRDNVELQRALTDVLTAWGSCTPTDIIIRAAGYTMVANRDTDPIQDALARIGYQILCGDGAAKAAGM